MVLKDEIIEYCYGLDLAAIGFCDALPFYDVEMELLERKRRGEKDIPFVETDIAKRVYPDLTLKGAKSFIVILVDYRVPTYKYNKEELSGNISPAAIGADYHKQVMSKLESIKSFIEMKVGDCNILNFADSSPFVERRVAVRAGLGFIGKNGMLLSEELGSRTFIGIMLTDIDFPADMPMFNIKTKCSTCNQCVKLCPNHAIEMNGGMDIYKCVSYLTQDKSIIHKDSLSAIGCQVYGCDICQMVCPYNKPIPQGHYTGVKVRLTDILNMTNKEFEQYIKPTAAGWRGKKILQRNAIIALGNLGNNLDAVKLLENAKMDSRVDIAAEARRQLERKDI